MNIVYECILNKIAYEKCDELRDNNKIEIFKKRAKSRGKNGEDKTAKDLFNNYNLNEFELNYVSSIVVSFIYKLDRQSLDKIRKNLVNNDNITCKSCGRNITLNEIEIDHILPFSYHGESRNPNNYQTLCHECNQLKKADPWFPMTFYCKRGFFPLYCTETNTKYICGEDIIDNLL